MKIVMFNCSPRVNSSSGYLLQCIEEAIVHIFQDAELQLFDCDDFISSKEALSDYRKIVIAAPVYVATVPAQMIALLEHIYLSQCFAEATEVFFVSNSGFCKAEASLFSIEVVRNWCEKCGFSFKHALCVASGWRIDPTSINTPDIRTNIMRRIVSFAKRLLSYDSLELTKKRGLHDEITKTVQAIVFSKDNETIAWVEPALPKTQLAGNILFNSLVLSKRIMAIHQESRNSRERALP